MFAYDTDRQEQLKDNAALDAELDGIDDGYSGKLYIPGTVNADYIKGYTEGIRQAWEEQKRKLARYAEYAAREEARKAGQADWLDTVLQDNDEPTLGFDEMEEEPNLIVGSEEIVIEFPNGTSCIHYFDTDTEF